MSEAKPTPGPCYHHGPSGSQHTAGGFINTTPDRNGSPVICSVYGTNGQPHEANARLIIDAFDTMTTTGLTPSQLVERVKELESVLSDARNELYSLINTHNKQDEHDGSWLYDWQTVVEIDAALSKARPNTAEGEVPGQAQAGADDPQLLKFYGVTTDAELIAAQARHIERLQAKLPQTPSFAPQRVREG